MKSILEIYKQFTYFWFFVVINNMKIIIICVGDIY